MKSIDPIIGKGFLKLEDFKNLLDNNSWLKEIELSNYGEIFLNPDLLNIMKYAFERGVILTGTNGVNLNSAKGEVLEGLVKYQFRSITCSIDGASNKTYELYRVRGLFDTVIENIQKINFYKRQYQSAFPQLTWQFVVFGHNEHEIATAREMAAELGMRFRPKLSWNSEFSPIRNPQHVKKEIRLKAASREEYKKHYGKSYAHLTCYQLWDNPQVNWDGKLLGCDVNYWGDFGPNVFERGLLPSINNDKLQYAKNMLLGKAPARADIPCSTCDIYLTMQASGQWVQRRWYLTFARYIYFRFGMRYKWDQLRALVRKYRLSWGSGRVKM
jgi:hypothetical protein